MLGDESVSDSARLLRLERNFRSLVDRNSNIAEETGASVGFVSYDVRMTTGGVTPTMGNGTLSGSYTVINGIVFFNIFHQLGSSTSYTAGNIVFSLPLPILAYSELNVSAFLHDVSASGNYKRAAFNVSGSTESFYLSAENGTVVSTTVPFTWASGDFMTISGFYKKVQS